MIAIKDYLAEKVREYSAARARPDFAVATSRMGSLGNLLSGYNLLHLVTNSSAQGLPIQQKRLHVWGGDCSRSPAGSQPGDNLRIVGNITYDVQYLRRTFG